MRSVKTVPDRVKGELCSRFGGEPSTLRFLGGGRAWSDGVVFTFTPVAPAPSRAMVLKIIEFRSDDAEGPARAEDRVRLVRAFGEEGVRIAFPEPSPAGALFEVVTEGERVFVAYVSAFARGRPIGRHDRLAHSSAYYRALGSLLGRLHAVSQARPETAIRKADYVGGESVRREDRPAGPDPSPGRGRKKDSAS